MKSYTVYTVEAGENERLAPGALDGLVGKIVPWTYRETDDGPVVKTLGTARVVGVTVEPDGSAGYVEVELVRGVEDVRLPEADSPGSMSFSAPAADEPIRGDLLIGDPSYDRRPNPADTPAPAKSHGSQSPADLRKRGSGRSKITP